MSEFSSPVMSAQEIGPGATIRFEDDDLRNYPDRLDEHTTMPTEYDASHDQESLSNTAYTYKEVDGAFRPIEHDEDGNEIVNMDPGLVFDIKDKEQQDAYEEARTTGEPVEFEMLKRMPDLNVEIVLWRINQTIIVYESDNGIYMTLATRTEVVPEEEEEETEDDSDTDSGNEIENESPKQETSKSTDLSEAEKNDASEDSRLGAKEAEIASALAVAKQAAEEASSDSADDTVDQQQSSDSTFPGDQESTPQPNDSQEEDTSALARPEMTAVAPVKTTDVPPPIVDAINSGAAVEDTTETTASSDITPETLSADDQKLDEAQEPQQVANNPDVATVDSELDEETSGSNLSVADPASQQEFSSEPAVDGNPPTQEHDSTNSTATIDIEPVEAVTVDDKTPVVEEFDVSTAEPAGSVTPSAVEPTPVSLEHDRHSPAATIDTPFEPPVVEVFVEQVYEITDRLMNDEPVSIETDEREVIERQNDSAEEPPKTIAEVAQPTASTEATAVLRVQDVRSEDHSVEHYIDLRPEADEKLKSPVTTEDTVGDKQETSLQTPPSHEALQVEIDVNPPKQAQTLEQPANATLETSIKPTATKQGPDIARESTPATSIDTPDSSQEPINLTLEQPYIRTKPYQKEFSSSQISLQSIRTAINNRTNEPIAPNSPLLAVSPDSLEYSDGRNRQLTSPHRSIQSSPRAPISDLYQDGSDLIIDTFYEPRDKNQMAKSLTMEVMR